MLFNEIKIAYKGNANFKGRIVVCSYVFMRFFRVRMTNGIYKILYSPVVIIYKLITDLLLKCEIPASTNIGSGLVLHHVTGLVLNSKVVLGQNVTINHNTTIGNKRSINGDDLGSPKIGNNVTIGPHSVIIGPIVIGDNVIIGAGSVVVKDVPSNCVVAGNPAGIIKRI